MLYYILLYILFIIYKYIYIYIFLIKYNKRAIRSIAYIESKFTFIHCLVSTGDMVSERVTAQDDYSFRLTRANLICGA